MGFISAAIILSGGRFVALERAYLDGYIFALCAGASFALFSVLASRASYEPVSSMFFIQLYSSVIVTLLLITTKGFRSHQLSGKLPVFSIPGFLRILSE